MLDSGFGKPPKEFFHRSLTSGVIMPGLVNAHSRIQLSAYKDKLPSNTGQIKYLQLLNNIDKQENSVEFRKVALSAIDYAFSKGTFFYNDVSADPTFTEFLRSAHKFKGNRFLELNSFDPKADDDTIMEAVLAIENDVKLFPTVASIYQSSPRIMQTIREKARLTTMTINLLDCPDEWEFPFEKGKLYQSFKQRDKYFRHPELYHTHVLPYLHGMNMLSFKKLFLVGLLFANRKEIEYLNDTLPHAAWVLTHRKGKFLGYKRKNWDLLKTSPLKMLIGTSGAVTSGDVSIMDEVFDIYQDNIFKMSELLLAVTYSSYEYFEISAARVPYFLYPDCKPNLESLSQVKKTYMLKG